MSVRAHPSAIVNEGAQIDASFTVVRRVELGRYAFVGAGAVINRNVPDFALIVGAPARQIDWMSRYGERIPLPVEDEGAYLCPHTQDRYVLAGRRLRCDPARD